MTNTRTQLNFRKENSSAAHTGSELMTEPDDTFSFGAYHLSRRHRLLTESSQSLILGTRAFDLLLMLVERAGTLISKRELLERVWPGILVEESNLHVQMATLRKALGADRNFIRTVPGRGYYFVADVTRTRDATVERLAHRF